MRTWARSVSTSEIWGENQNEIGGVDATFGDISLNGFGLEGDVVDEEVLLPVDRLRTIWYLERR